MISKIRLYDRKERQICQQIFKTNATSYLLEKINIKKYIFHIKNDYSPFEVAWLQPLYRNVKIQPQDFATY